MNKSLELAQDKIIEKIGNMCSKFGLNQFVAQLFTVLYLSKVPLSLDDLVSRLKVSKGNVSINIRELERMGAVRKIWVKGSRKDFYEAELDIKKIFTQKLKSAVEKRVTEVSDMIEEFKTTVVSTNGQLSEEDKAITADYLERLNKIEELKTLVSSALVFADKLL